MSIGGQGAEADSRDLHIFSSRIRTPMPQAPLAVEKVPLPLEGRDRAVWRIATTLLCLAHCRNNSASIEQLHVLTWALQDVKNMTMLRRLWESQPGTGDIFRARNPRLEDTLKLARASQLVAQTRSGKYSLTERGENVINSIVERSGALESENVELAQLGSISESQMWKRLGTRSPRTRNTRYPR